MDAAHVARGAYILGNDFATGYLATVARCADSLRHHGTAPAARALQQALRPVRCLDAFEHRNLTRRYGGRDKVHHYDLAANCSSVRKTPFEL